MSIELTAEPLVCDDSPWTEEEADALAWEASQLAGWNDSRMDEYNEYDPQRKKE